jgi:hypothetical protein
MAQGFSARLLAERPKTSDPRACGRQLRRTRCRCGQAEDRRAGRWGRGSSSLEQHGRGDGLRAEGVGARSMCLVWVDLMDVDIGLAASRSPPTPYLLCMAFLPCISRPRIKSYAHR